MDRIISIHLTEGNKTMTAIDALRKALEKNQREQAECITEDGHVITAFRYQYQILIREAQAFNDAINYLESIREVTR